MRISRWGTIGWGFCALGGLLAAATPACSSSSGANPGPQVEEDGGTDSGSVLPTLLPVDCRDKINENPDPVCEEGDAPIGSGARLADDFGGGGGFVDGNRLVFPVVYGNTVFAIYTMDLDTKVRTVLSGKYHDPAKGNISVGSGPEFLGPNGILDMEKGPDGAYYVFGHDKDHGAAKPFVYRIDPTSGDRTVAVDFDAEAMACTTRSGEKLQPNNVSKFSAGLQTYLWLTFGADGTMYVPMYYARPLGGLNFHEISGVGGIKDGKCRIVTLDDYDAKDNVGTGFGLTQKQGKSIIATIIAPLKFGNGALYGHVGFDRIMKVDIATGNREIISATDPDIGSGPPVHHGYMLVAPDGAIWTAGTDLQHSLITSTDPATGNRTGYSSVVRVAHDARPLLGIHPTKPFVYYGNRSNTIEVLEYTTGNGNLVAR